MEYTKCPKCGKNGIYTAYARNVGEHMAFNNQGSEEHCRYCNPRGITKKEKEDFKRRFGYDG